MLALLCPGQGSQRSGVLTEWFEVADGLDFDARALIDRWSAAADVDLTSLGCTADDDTIRDTANAQPLIVALSLLSWQIVHAASGARPQVTAGHSVGELAALAIAGVLSDEQAVALAAARGAAMARAARAADSSMAAVVGGKRDDVLKVLTDYDLVPANINGSTQVVAAGASSDLDAMAGNLPRGARMIPLSVAGAFHTRFMADAVPDVTAAVANLAPGEPECTLLSNRDGAAVATGAEALRRIVDQITLPVRWDRCQDALREAGVSAIVELAPAGVLAGLAKRDLKGVPATALGPDTVNDCVALLQGETDR